MAFRVLVRNLVPLRNETTGEIEPPGTLYAVAGKQDPRPVGKRIGLPVYEFTLMARPGPLEGLGFGDLDEATEVMRQVTSLWDEEHKRQRYSHFQIDGDKTFTNTRPNFMGPRNFGPP
jgi:hypothetical protein